MTKSCVLLVEADSAVCALQAQALEHAGYHVTRASHGRHALELLEASSSGGAVYDLVVADVGGGSITGLALLEAAMRLTPAPEVVLTTAVATVETAVAALRGGASDYLIKPIAPADLKASIAQALERRAARATRAVALVHIAHELTHIHTAALRGFGPRPETPPTATSALLRVGPLVLDTARRLARWHGRPLLLTPIEHALLRYLAETPSQVHRYSAIVHWTHDLDTGEHEAKVLLKSHARNLRRKIDPGYFINVKGVGYMLVADPLDANTLACEEAAQDAHVAAA